MPPTAKAADLSAVFAGLQITPSDEPLPEPTHGSSAGPNPFTEPLKASIAHEKPYSFYLPVDAVQRAVFLINAAARKENKGVRIVVNTKKDKDGKVVKKDGKVQYAPETSGPNAGNVLVRFQGKNERKQQTAPRPYSIVKDKADPNVHYVRRRADKVNVFKGTQEECKAEYDRLKIAEANKVVPVTAPAQSPAPTGEAQPTPQSTVEADQGATPSDIEPKQEGAPAA